MCTRNVISYYSDPAIAKAFHTDRYGGPVGQWFLREETRSFQWLINRVGSPSSVLDLGVGTGKLSLSLADGVWYAGIDRSLPMLGVLRTMHQGIPLLAADAQVLPFRRKSVDIVLASRLLMHLPNWELTIGESCRIARHAVILDFPVSPSLAALEPRLWRWVRRDPHPPHRIFSFHQIAHAFELQGFVPAYRRRGFVGPYRFHRALKNLTVSRVLERVAHICGCTRHFGSPEFAAFVPAELLHESSHC